MTMKSLLLGATAGLFAVGSAHAADLPMEKAEAVEYVKVCSEFGAGYFYIPGGDTCLKISGFVRADFTVQDTDSDKSKDDTTIAGRGQYTFDARTATAMGELRSIITINNNFSNTGTSSPEIDRAFLQLGGFTAGFARTFFVPVGATTQDLFGGNAGMFDAGRPLFGYTATFGGGFAASLSIESKATGDAKFVTRDVAAGAFLTTTAFFATTGTAAVRATEEGQSLPDIVASLAYASGPISASLSAAIHQNEVFDNRTTTTAASGDSNMGFAIGAGIQYAAAPVTVSVYGAYADGAVKYIPFSTGGTDVVVGATAATGGSLTLSNNTAWKIGASLGFDVSPSLNLGLGGSYGEFDSAMLATDVSSDNDFKEWNIYAAANYTVVPNFVLSVGGGYTDRDNLTVADTDTWQFGVRVKRSF